MLEIDVVPNKPAQFGGAQAGQQGSQDHRPMTIGGRGDDGLELGLARHLQPIRAPLALDSSDGANVVGRDQAARLSFPDDRRQRAKYALSHVAGAAIVEQLIAEGVHGRNRQARQLERADMRDDVQIYMLPISRDRSRLELIALAACQPERGRLCYRDRGAVRSVDSGCYFAARADVKGVGFSLGWELAMPANTSCHPGNQLASESRRWRACAYERPRGTSWFSMSKRSCN